MTAAGNRTFIRKNKNDRLWSGFSFAEINNCILLKVAENPEHTAILY